MKLSAGRNTLAAVAAVLLLGVVGARLDVPRLLGKTRGDEANYVAMALSVAEDHDLKYAAADYQRFRRLYGTGPEGIFLKKEPGSHAGQLDFAKPYVYGVAAAPFAKLMGLGGLLVFNLLLLGADLWCAVAFARARAGAVSGTLLGLAFIGASAVPVYAVWLTPELLNVSLTLWAYFLWLYKEAAGERAPSWLRSPALDWVAAGLLAVATFSKPIHAPLIAPIVLTALFRRQLARAIGIGALFLALAGGLYGVNTLLTGDWNYQGGEAGARRYFLTHFPFDEDNTPFERGKSMSTDQANDENIFAPSYVRRTLPQNLVYFLAGRDAGLLPYFFPGALIALLWFARVRQSPLWQWLTAGAVAAAIAALLLFAPDVWNGGGGPIGNRYFLGLYPALLFLLPAETGLLSALAATAVGLVCLGPILVRPIAASREPWLNPERWPLRVLPIELTILNDLPVRLNPQRWRVQVSKDPEVFLYYMDGRKYFEEADGFWVAPGTAEIVVRTERPLTGLTLRIKSPIDNTVDTEIGGRSQHIELHAGSEARIQLRPDPGWYALRSFQVVWRITTAKGFYPKDLNAGATDTRLLGAFITAQYEVR